MTTLEIMQADLLDIVFEHRNKSYGAYILRRQYNKRLLTALGVALSLVGLFYMLAFFNRQKEQRGGWKVGDPNPVELKQLVIPPKETEPKTVTKQSPVAQVKSLAIRIVPDPLADEVPEQKDIETKIISTQTVEGAVPDDPNMKLAEPAKGDDKTGDKTVVSDFKPEEIPPSFPGGLEALALFFSRNLSSPADLEPGEKKIVLVRFVVGADGIVSNAEVTQSGGDSYDREVLRAFKRMPRWVPASQNGIKIAVSFTQPVTFIGTEP